MKKKPFFRCQGGKKLLMASLICWILFTIPLSFIRPEAVKCIERNHTDLVLTYTRTKRDIGNYNTALADEDFDMNDNFGLNTDIFHSR